MTSFSLISIFINFKIIKTRRQKRKLDSKPEPILKPELDASRERLRDISGTINTDRQPVYEAAEGIGSRRDFILVEADGREFYRHEMAVNEDVAVEMVGIGVMQELDGNDPINGFWLGHRLQSPIHSALEN